MIWLTWRQFRTQGVVVAAMVAVFGVILLITGPELASLYHGSSFATCHSGCGQAAGDFLVQAASGNPYHLVYLLGDLLIILLPTVIGLFWGAPLIARELDSGTFRLAWNQSVTRERWLATKLGILGLGAMAAAGVLSLILGWWASPIDRAAALQSNGGFQDRFFPLVFGTRGIAPLGYAAFAFALGVLVGLLIRRTVPAMAVTLVLVAAVQIVFPLLIRPHLITPVRVTTPVTASEIQGMIGTGGGPGPGSGPTRLTHVQVAATGPSGAWVISDQTLTASGSASLGNMPSACNGSGFQGCATAIAQKDLKEVVNYQPASRYWSFQLIETGIYLTVAILLAWTCFWFIRRRLS